MNLFPWWNAVLHTRPRHGLLLPLCFTRKKYRMKEGAHACLSLPRAGQQASQPILLLWRAWPPANDPASQFEGDLGWVTWIKRWKHIRQKGNLHPAFKCLTHIHSFSKGCFSLVLRFLWHLQSQKLRISVCSRSADDLWDNSLSPKPNYLPVL